MPGSGPSASVSMGANDCLRFRTRGAGWLASSAVYYHMVTEMQIFASDSYFVDKLAGALRRGARLLQEVSGLQGHFCQECKCQGTERPVCVTTSSSGSGREKD